MTHRIGTVLLTAFLAIPVSHAQELLQTAETRSEILHLIRQEKLDLILPEFSLDQSAAAAGGPAVNQRQKGLS